METKLQDPITSETCVDKYYALLLAERFTDRNFETDPSREDEELVEGQDSLKQEQEDLQVAPSRDAVLREIEKKTSDRFERLIEKIELIAKGLDLPESSPCLNIKHLLEAHAKTQFHQKLTAPRQKALRELLNRAKLERKQLGRQSAYRAGTTSKRIGGSKKVARNPGLRRKRRFADHGDDDSELDVRWPRSDHGFFCLLRGFLTYGGERRRLTTAQLCEYVREWQSQMGLKLQRAGGPCSWISRADDWSAITPHALSFLTGEISSPTSVNTSLVGIIRHSSRRLSCPRPFVDSKPRVHQWSWLLAAPPALDKTPTSESAAADSELRDKFDRETKELAALFLEWIRAPRGLGGLNDAILISSASLTSRPNKQGRRKGSKQAADKVEGLGGSPSRDNDSEDSEDLGRLTIDDSLVLGLNDDLENLKKIKKEKKKCARTKQVQACTSPGIDPSIPPPLYPSNWKLRPFSDDERADFRRQEAERFSRPWSPYIYQIQDYQAVVGPLRSASTLMAQNDHQIGSSQRTNPMAYSTSQSHSKAREHPLLRSDRPMFVSLAEIVRDAVACLPNGEGTRADIATLVQNSGFLLASVNQRQLQQCVSSALDRLQGEAPDPSVFFNGTRRVWIYRHRYRTPEEFARLHEARCAVNETKKSLQRGLSTSRRPSRPMQNTDDSSNYFYKHSDPSSTGHRHSAANYPAQRPSQRSRHMNRDYSRTAYQGRQDEFGRRDYPGRVDDFDDEDLDEDYVDDNDDDDDGIPDIEDLEAADHFSSGSESQFDGNDVYEDDPNEYGRHDSRFMRRSQPAEWDMNYLEEDEPDPEQEEEEDDDDDDYDDEDLTGIEFERNPYSGHQKIQRLDPYQQRIPMSFGSSKPKRPNLQPRKRPGHESIRHLSHQASTSRIARPNPSHRYQINRPMNFGRSGQSMAQYTSRGTNKARGPPMRSQPLNFEDDDDDGFDLDQDFDDDHY